jgi:hypothetical protein
MKLSALSCLLAGLFCGLPFAHAQMSREFISAPSSYLFVFPGYETTAPTNAEIATMIHAGDPSYAGVTTYWSSDGTAIAGRDYLPVSGTIQFNGPMWKMFTVPILPSTSLEDKTVNLHINSGGGRIGSVVLVIHPSPILPAIPPTLAVAIFKLTASTQAHVQTVIGAKTNSTAIATNVTRSYKSVINSGALDGAAMLSLLANSFNTNFPTGSQIAFRAGHLYVVDGTGANVVFDPTNAVTLDCRGTLLCGLETRVTREENGSAALSGTTSETVTSRVVVNYDDSALATADGTVTKFNFSGLWTMKLSTTLQNQFSKVAITFQGSGDGTIRNQPAILTGLITASGAGTP